MNEIANVARRGVVAAGLAVLAVWFAPVAAAALTTDNFGGSDCPCAHGCAGERAQQPGTTPPGQTQRGPAAAGGD